MTPFEQIEQNTALVRCLFEETVNRGNLAVVDELMAPEVIDHNPGPSDAPGRDGLKEVFWMLRHAFPDLNGRIDDLICDGDFVIIHWAIGGTNTQRCMGIGPTHRAMQGTGMDILRIADGRVVERWGNSDDMRMLAQMGLLEDVLSCPDFNPHSSQQFSSCSRK